MPWPVRSTRRQRPSSLSSTTSHPAYGLGPTGSGSAPEHAQLVTQIRESLPPLFDLVTPMPYVELQKLLDEAWRLGLLRL